MANTPATLACSFCGKGQAQVRRLIAGPLGVFICDECVALCNDILAMERGSTPRTPTEGGPRSPQRSPRSGWRSFLPRH